MRTITAGMLALAAVAGAACNDHPAAPAGPSYSASGLAAASTAAGARQGFGFNGTVSGFPTGAVFITGGGSFDAATASNVVPTETDVKSGGGFRCVAAVALGPLAGCAAGQGGRWDTAQLLASTTFTRTCPTPYTVPCPPDHESLWTSRASTSAILRLDPTQLSVTGERDPATTLTTPSARLQTLFGVAFDPSGEMWITSADDNRLVA